MKITTRCHLRTLSETVELGLIASVAALTADLGWLTKDIIHNGFTAGYLGVGIGLLGGLLLTGYALFYHHRNGMKTKLQELYKTKLERIAAKKKRFEKRGAL